MLQISVLGPLEIELDGAPLEHQPAKTRVLLAYLAVENRPVARTVVAQMLWPFQTVVQGRHSLRNAVMTARKAALPLQGDGGKLWLECFKCDYHEFLQYPLPGLYRGSFLYGLDHRLSEPFEEWLRHQRACCEGRIAEVLLQVAESPDESGSALAAARRLMDADPLSEAGCRALVRACWRSDRVLALRTYQAHRAALAREYAIEPSAETQALMKSLIVEG